MVELNCLSKDDFRYLVSDFFEIKKCRVVSQCLSSVGVESQLTEPE